MTGKYAFTLPASKHSELSASAAKRWTNCAGCVKQSAGVIQVTSEYAAEGTAGHYIAAKTQTDGGNADRWLGKVALVEGIEVPITQDLVDAINDFLRHVRSETPKDAQVYIERSITPALQKLHPKLGGTADRIAYLPTQRVLRVTDLKLGRGIAVEVPANIQLQIYALGALLSLPGIRPERIEIEIAQPRLEHADGKYRRWSFETVDILDFAADIVAAAKATDNPDAKLCPGEWCKSTFCPAAVDCPALAEQSRQLMAPQFDDLTRISIDTLAGALSVLPQIEARIEAIRAYAYAEAQRGNTPPGFKLVSKRPTRRWTSVEAVTRKLLHNPDYYTTPEFKSPAQIEKILGAAVFAKEVGEFVESKSSGQTLVPVSDPRPEVKLLTADAFDDESEKA